MLNNNYQKSKKISCISQINNKEIVKLMEVNNLTMFIKFQVINKFSKINFKEIVNNNLLDRAVNREVEIAHVSIEF